MISIEQQNQFEKITPPCEYFGECGGCLYQDIPYEKELEIKQDNVCNLLCEEAGVSREVVETIVPSEKHYHYRNRLDLKLIRTRERKVFIGFSPQSQKRVIPVDKCWIAREEISSFIPALKIQAEERLPEKKYRQANLVVRTGDEGKVFWGGIGRRSCVMEEKDYFFTTINSKKIFYSLDTFFQANLSILPELFKRITALNILDKDTILFDLYGGVGLFSFGLSGFVKKSVLVEVSTSSVILAKYNAAFHPLNNLDIVEDNVENVFGKLIQEYSHSNRIAIIDPPRSGLTPEARELLCAAKDLKAILYLSCHPESLKNDIVSFLQNDWAVEKVIPFDFFPRTKHVETLVVLKNT